MDVYGRGPGPGQISEVSRARAPGSSNERKANPISAADLPDGRTDGRTESRSGGPLKRSARTI